MFRTGYYSGRNSGDNWAFGSDPLLKWTSLLDQSTTVFVPDTTDALGLAFANDGRRRIVEAYPAAALSMWGIPRGDYKMPASHDRREAMLAVLERAGPSGWLAWESGMKERCVGIDHALDAVVCALVARAAALGTVEPVHERDRGAACQEGWIALPRPDALTRLLMKTSPWR